MSERPDPTGPRYPGLLPAAGGRYFFVTVPETWSITRVQHASLVSIVRSSLSLKIFHPGVAFFLSGHNQERPGEPNTGNHIFLPFFSQDPRTLPSFNIAKGTMVDYDR